MKTTHTTKLTALFPSSEATTIHTALASIVAPVSERHFDTTPNRTIDGTDYCYISTVTLPEVAEAWRQVAESHPVDLSPTLSPYAPSSYEPLPEQGEPVTGGTIYSDGESLWMARQDHTRTEHSPGEVLALFVRYRHPEQGLQWIDAETVEAGTLREYEGAMYRAVQGHTTQSTWAPPLVPALWALIEVPTEDEPLPEPTPDEPEEPEGVPEWEVGVTYETGDQVTYQGVVYQCRQPHPSYAHQPPSLVPALWEVVE